MKIKIILACIASNFVIAQVGINTPNPAASLDVVAKKTDGTTSEGIIAPRLSGDQIKSADSRYTNPQTGTLVYATGAVNGSTTKTANITAPGYYYFDGVIWQKMAQDKTTFPGDIKHSSIAADHGGWYLLNGRAISGLPAAARTAAASLGFIGNIPNATNRVLKTKTGAEVIGTVGGVATLSIARANLPAFNFAGSLTGNLTAAGAHTHTVTGTAANSGIHTHIVNGNAVANGQHSHTLNGSATNAGGHVHGPAAGNSFLLGGTMRINNGTGNYHGDGVLPAAWGGTGAHHQTASAGAHTHSITGSAAANGNHGHTLNINAANSGNHTHALSIIAAQAANHTHSLANVNVTVPSGGTGQALDNRSPYLVVNTFIYLGQ